MRWRYGPAENAVVARQMRGFFAALPAEARKNPRRVAALYADYVFHRRRHNLVDDKRRTASRFHVGIGIGPGAFDRVTKRAVLVSDTLLLSHNGHGAPHRVGTFLRQPHLPSPGAAEEPCRLPAGPFTTEILRMYCPDMEDLGRWLLNTEPLLRAGLAWYLPTYSVSRDEAFRGMTGADLSAAAPTVDRAAPTVDGTAPTVDGAAPTAHSEVPGLLDFLRTGRRVVAQGDTPSLKSQVVRPVVEDVDLPFLDGVPTDVFSAVTVEEFHAYRAFRSWLRQEMLNLDTALNAMESERELMKISLRIQDGMLGMRSRMGQVRRKRAVAATGAVIGTVSATLVAVHGPAMQAALTALLGGATGGLWGALQAGSENSPRTLRDDAWYYVWQLSRADHSRTL
ncbi:hypothetical protein [Streptomyces sp. URMC 123]|uniref:hypothetical protein n=1 Tax=Streptomyces sp. URMC 123 TaxID=3423403 RepID=UPI003F1C2BE7